MAIVNAIPSFEKSDGAWYDVFCSVCLEHIGILDGKELAAMSMSKKGVLCFDCDNVNANRVSTHLDFSLGSVGLCDDVEVIVIDPTKKGAHRYLPNGQKDDYGNRLFILAREEQSLSSSTYLHAENEAEAGK